MALEIAGQTFGRLTAVRPSTGRYWLCTCECGELLEVNGYHVRSGHTQSCGCLQREQLSERRLVHGHKRSDAQKSPTYESWQAMRARCSNSSRHNYARYGGRGIKVCDEWQSFENFLRDVGERPPGKTLDRYPNRDGDYEPGNVRWATATEQAANK